MSSKSINVGRDHGKACKAWFSALSAEEKACATACSDPKFIRMYLNLTKRMEARLNHSSNQHGADSSQFGCVSSNSSKPVNHPRSDSTQILISRRHLAKMYETSETASFAMTSHPTLSKENGKQISSTPMYDAEFVNLNDIRPKAINLQGSNKSSLTNPQSCQTSRSSIHTVGLSETITSQSEGPKRIQNESEIDVELESRTRNDLTEEEAHSLVKSSSDLNRSTSYSSIITSEISASNEKNQLGSIGNLLESSLVLESARLDNKKSPREKITLRDAIFRTSVNEIQNCMKHESVPVLDKSKSISAASSLQSKARLAALTVPFGRNGVEVLLLDPSWLGSGTKSPGQEVLFCVAEDILQQSHGEDVGGFLSEPPKEHCEYTTVNPVVLPSWLIPCSEAFSKPVDAATTTSFMGIEDINVPFHLLLVARIELSIWTAYWRSKQQSYQQSSIATHNPNLSKVLARAKDFKQHGLSIGHIQCRRIMSPVTLLKVDSRNEASSKDKDFVSEYDSLDKLILLPIPWVLLHGRDAEQYIGNIVGYVGAAHPVWKCIEKVEGAIADKAWIGVSADGKLKQVGHEAQSLLSSNGNNTVNAAQSVIAQHIGGSTVGSKKKRKGKANKKKKKKAQQNQEQQRQEMTTKKSNVNPTLSEAQIFEKRQNNLEDSKNERIVSCDHGASRSISSATSSSSSSSTSSSSIALPSVKPKHGKVVTKENENKNLTITTSATGKTVVSTSSISSQSSSKKLSVNDKSDSEEWDIVGQKNNRGRNNNRWGNEKSNHGNNGGDRRIKSQAYQKQSQHQQSDVKVAPVRQTKQSQSKRHGKNKKIVSDIVQNSLLPLVEFEINRRSAAAGKIQKIRTSEDAAKKTKASQLKKSASDSNHNIDMINYPQLPSCAAQVDSSYSGVTSGTLTSTTACPESSTLSTANNTPNNIPPVMTVSNDICIGGNSTTSSVASSLDHHPNSMLSHPSGCGADRAAKHHNQDDPSKSVGYHLLNVCNRLSSDMATFMGRRGIALAARRRERGRLLQALQGTASRIWPTNNCHVEMYGSCATQLDLPSSDLDLVICGLPVEKNTQNTAASRVYMLADELERQSWAVHVKPIATATVPVVKLLADPSRLLPAYTDDNHHHQHRQPQDVHMQQHIIQHQVGYHAHHMQNGHQRIPTPWRGADVMNNLLQIDITFEGPEHGGVGSTEFAARMVQDAMNESGLPRPEATPAVQVLMVLKELLAQRRLNEPFSGGLSSYGLILMVFAVIRENRALRAQYKAQADMMTASAQREEQNRLQQQKKLQKQQSTMVKVPSWASIAKVKQQHQSSQNNSQTNTTAPKITRSSSAPASVTPNSAVLSQENSARSVLTSSSGGAADTDLPSTSCVVSGKESLFPKSKINNNDGEEVIAHESNDILEVICSGEPTAGKLLMHFLLFYGHIFDATRNAIEVRSPHSPVIPRQVGAIYDPVTGLFSADQLVVFDPLEGSEKNNVARSCFAWMSIRWVFAQSYTTLTNTLDRRGSIGEEMMDESSPLLELLMSY